VVHGWNPAAVYCYGAVLDSGLNAELPEETRHGLSGLLRPWKDEFPTGGHDG